MTSLRLALLQTPQSTTSAEALERLGAAARESAARGAQWLISPEMFLTGYLVDPGQLGQQAEALDGSLIRAVRSLARQHGIGIVTGWPEARGGALPFNSAVAVDETGEVRAVHRKVHLFGEGDATRFSPGTEPPALFEWRGWRLGLLICFDVEHDEPLQSLAARSADAVLVPTANMVGFDEVQHRRLPDAARRFGVAIAYANACGAEGHTVYNGLTSAFSAAGERLALAGREPELVLVTIARPGS